MIRRSLGHVERQPVAFVPPLFALKTEEAHGTTQPALLSVAQRRLSTPARAVRRYTAEVNGEQRFTDGSVVELNRARLSAPLEGAPSALWLALVLLAAALVVVRL